MRKHRPLIPYYDKGGRKPAKVKLDDLRSTRPEEYHVLMDKVDFVERATHQQASETGTLKHVREKIHEIKPKGRQARLLVFPWSHEGQDYLVAVELDIKKQDQLDENAIQRAIDRYEDWIKRFGS